MQQFYIQYEKVSFKFFISEKWIMNFMHIQRTIKGVIEVW